MLNSRSFGKQTKILSFDFDFVLIFEILRHEISNPTPKMTIRLVPLLSAMTHGFG
jgi:hypothetical protein